MGKKFDFRLENVLRLKTQKVDEQKESLNKVLFLKHQKELEIEQQENYCNNLFNSGTGKVSAENLQIELNHKKFIEEEILRLRHEHQQLREIEELKRAKLTEAMKEEKVLVKLKDKKLTSWGEENKKEETKTLDEIAGQRHGKNS